MELKHAPRKKTKQEKSHRIPSAQYQPSIRSTDLQRRNKAFLDFISLRDKTEQRHTVVTYEGRQFLRCAVLQQHSLWIRLRVIYRMFITAG